MTSDLGRDKNEFIVTDRDRPPFEPIRIFLRGMEKTGADTKVKSGSTSYVYEMSLLSDGIKCATQGCKYELCGMMFVSLYENTN